MKIYLFLLLGLILSLSAISNTILNIDVKSFNASNPDIEEQMEKRFAIRDTFKEKGNSGKYLRTNNVQF